MVDSQILLSIIIPAFNAENYIEKCINRIVPLLDCDVECIVVDDGSTDNTLKLLRNISNDIVNINIISQNNTGVSGARNNALKKANGKYICYIDIDDVIDTGTLKKVIEYLRNNLSEELVVFPHYEGNESKGFILRFNNSLKALIGRRQNIFEGLNIRYFGPLDGHDVGTMVRVLNDIKDMTGPKLLHLRTVKGKGYAPAEKAATEWHAPGKFNIETGERLIPNSNNLPPLFQDVFGLTLLELAEKNEKIVGITPAMPTGCSMTYMMNKYPHRTFDVGIAEEHAVTFSGGLAKEGLIPFCNIYSTFMQRAFDEVIHDVAIQNLHVIFCLDRAGLVGEDGVTHHGAFDLSYMRCIPNMTIASPMNEHYLRHLMYTAQAEDTGVFTIRYPRGRGVLTDWKCTPKLLEIGKGRKLKDGNDIALISIGPIGNIAAKAIEKAEEAGASIAHYDMIFLKPIDEGILHEIGRKFKRIVTVEDGSIKGGLGIAVLEFMSDNNYTPRIKRIGIPDQFIEHGTIAELYKLCKMDEENIKNILVSEW